MANRYSKQLPIAQFQPVSFEQYLQVPIANQQVHDQTLNSALANQTRIDNLSFMDEEARSIEKQLDSKIDEVVSEITDKGISNMNTTDKLLKLKEQKEKLFGRGSRGSQIAAAKQSRDQLSEEWDKLIAKGERSPLQKQKAMMAFDLQSKSLYEQGNIGYNGRILSKEVNAPEIMTKYLQSKPMSEIENETGWTMLNDGNWYNRITKESSRGTPEQLVRLAQEFAMSDPSIMNNYQDQAFLIESLNKDELGNVYYNGKSYNPETFRNEYLNNEIAKDASLAAQMAYERKFSSKTDMKVASDYQLKSKGLIPPNEPTIKYDVYSSGDYENENNFKLGAFTRKIVDSQGKNIPVDKLKELFTQYINNLPHISDKTELLKEKDKLFNSYMEMYLKGSLFDLGTTNVYNGLSASAKQIYNALVTMFSDEKYKVDNPEALILEFNEMLGGQNFKFEPLSEEDKTLYKQRHFQKLKEHQDNTFKFFQGTSQASSILAEKKLTPNEMSNLYEKLYEGKTKRPTETLGFDDDNYDLLIDDRMRQASERNDLSLLNLTGDIKVKTSENEILEGQDAYNYINSIGPNVKNVNKAEVIIKNENPRYMLGNKLDIKTDEGTVTLMVPPQSERYRDGRTYLSTFEESFSDFSPSTGTTQKTTSAPIYTIGNTNIFADYIHSATKDGSGNYQAQVYYKPYFYNNVNGEMVKQYLTSEDTGQTLILNQDEMYKRALNSSLSVIPR